MKPKIKRARTMPWIEAHTLWEAMRVEFTEALVANQRAHLATLAPADIARTAGNAFAEATALLTAAYIDAIGPATEAYVKRLQPVWEAVLTEYNLSGNVH